MDHTKGVFYMTGVGPGDPELITKKAIRILEHCSVIAAPQKGARSLALTIAGEAADLSGKEILPLTFPMTEDPKILAQNYRDIADQIRIFLNQGRDVAMVILGDVSIYSTGTYIYRLLKNEGYEAVMVPGVPSFCAVAAALGTSLTEGSRPMHVIPAGRTDLDSALELDGTKILMKSGTHIYDII